MALFYVVSDLRKWLYVSAIRDLYSIFVPLSIVSIPKHS